MSLISGSSTSGCSGPSPRDRGLDRGDERGVRVELELGVGEDRDDRGVQDLGALRGPAERVEDVRRHAGDEAAPDRPQHPRRDGRPARVVAHRPNPRSQEPAQGAAGAPEPALGAARDAREQRPGRGGEGRDRGLDRRVVGPGGHAAVARGVERRELRDRRRERHLLLVGERRDRAWPARPAFSTRTSLRPAPIARTYAAIRYTSGSDATRGVTTPTMSAAWVRRCRWPSSSDAPRSATTTWKPCSFGGVEDRVGLDRPERELGPEAVQRRRRQGEQAHPVAGLDHPPVEGRSVRPVEAGRQARDGRAVDAEAQRRGRVRPGRIEQRAPARRARRPRASGIGRASRPGLPPRPRASSCRRRPRTRAGTRAAGRRRGAGGRVARPDRVRGRRANRSGSRARRPGPGGGARRIGRWGSGVPPAPVQRRGRPVGTSLAPGSRRAQCRSARLSATYLARPMPPVSGRTSDACPDLRSPQVADRPDEPAVGGLAAHRQRRRKADRPGDRRRSGPGGSAPRSGGG